MLSTLRTLSLLILGLQAAVAAPSSSTYAEKDAVRSLNRGDATLLSWFQFRSSQGIQKELDRVKAMASQTSVGDEDLAAFWNLASSLNGKDFPADSRKSANALLASIANGNSPLQAHAQLALYKASATSAETWQAATALLSSHQVLKGTLQADGLTEWQPNPSLPLSRLAKVSPAYANALRNVATTAIQAMMENKDANPSPSSQTQRYLEAYKLAAAFSPETLQEFFSTYIFRSRLLRADASPLIAPAALPEMAWEIYYHYYSARCTDQEGTKSLQQTEMKDFKDGGACPGHNTTESHIKIDLLHSELQGSSEAVYQAKLGEILLGGRAYNNEEATASLDYSLDASVVLPVCTDLLKCSPTLSLLWDGATPGGASYSVTISPLDANSARPLATFALSQNKLLTIDRFRYSVEIKVHLERHDRRVGDAGWAKDPHTFALKVSSLAAMKAIPSYSSAMAAGNEAQNIAAAISQAMQKGQILTSPLNLLLQTSESLDPAQRFQTHYAKIFLANLLLEAPEIQLAPEDRSALTSLVNALSVDVKQKYGASVGEQLAEHLQNLRAIKNHAFLEQALATLFNEPAYNAKSRAQASQAIEAASPYLDENTNASLADRLDAIRALLSLQQDLNQLEQRWKTELDLLQAENSRFTQEQK